MRQTGLEPVTFGFVERATGSAISRRGRRLRHERPANRQDLTLPLDTARPRSSAYAQGAIKGRQGRHGGDRHPFPF